MKRYRSHKIVHAAIIVDAHLDNDGAGVVSYNDAEGRLTEQVVPAGFARPDTDPQPGDYLVKYDDDYFSWSPKDKFEAGYREMGQYEKG